MTWKNIAATFRSNRIKPIPKGWSTTAEIAKELGVSQRHAQSLCRQWVADGRVESQKWCVEGANSAPVPCVIYREKP